MNEDYRGMHMWNIYAMLIIQLLHEIIIILASQYMPSIVLVQSVVQTNKL